VHALQGRGERVVVTGSPDEVALTSAVSGVSDALDLGGRTTLAQLAGVLAGARAVVVGNTGPAHLAAAVGAPVVSIFARTVPRHRWRPWAVPHALLSAEVPCAGCRSRVCPVPEHPCMRRIGVEDVLAALDGVMAGSTPELEVAS
jgi:ADP-heptose:LPS heptosyltransferase